MAAPHVRPAADGAAAAGCTGWCGMSVALGGATACCDIPVISSQACVSGYEQHINIGSKVPAPAALAPGQLAELAAGRGGAHSRGSGAFAGTLLAGPGAEFNNGGSEPDCLLSYDISHSLGNLSSSAGLPPTVGSNVEHSMPGGSRLLHWKVLVGAGSENTTLPIAPLPRCPVPLVLTGLE